MGHAYEWLVEPDGGLDSIMYCYEKHSDVTDSLMSILIQYGKYNLIELFTSKIQSFFSEKTKYLEFITEAYTSVAETILAKESLLASGVLDHWIE